MRLLFRDLPAVNILRKCFGILPFSNEKCLKDYHDGKLKIIE